MADAASTSSYAPRWNDLLAENTVLHQEHLDLLSSLKPPFSAHQMAQLEDSAARRGNLLRKMQELVDDWTRGASA